MDDPIDEILEEALRRSRQGESISIDDYCHNYPDLADELRLMLPAMALLENPSRRAEPVSTILPTQIADYQIIRKLGSGGMGVVYEAIQQPLGRRVALKVINTAGVQPPGTSQRFRREAETAARLHHTHIVPVFDFGETDHCAYYAMQLIPGINLRQLLTFESSGQPAMLPSDQRRLATAAVHTTSVIAPPAVKSQADTHPLTSTTNNGGDPQLPGTVNALQLTWRDYVKMIQQVAEGLQFAHSQGIWHRDIKPANIMLDDRGSAWITDFGLARFQESSDLTATGEIVGTLRYLAPERFRGLQDHRSDIYSLGLTLYELLEQRPAYTAKDRIHLIQQITAGVSPRLTAKTANGGRDLVRVVSKSIAHDPSQRYQTAGEFAADLRRLGQGYPVHATRISKLKSLTFWARRNPLTAGLAVTTILALVVGLVVSSVFARQWQRSAREAVAEAQRSQQSLGLTRQAIAEMTSAVVTESITSDDTLTESHKEYLRNVLKLNEQLLALSGEDQSARELVAATYRQVGQIRYLLGDTDEALMAMQNAERMWHELSLEFPAKISYQLEFALAANDMGKWVGERSRMNEAHRLFQVAEQRIARLSSQAAAWEPKLREEIQLNAAMIDNNLANIDQHFGRYKAAIEGYSRALALYQSLLDEQPDNRDVLIGFARAQHNLALTLMKDGQLQAAQETNRIALEKQQLIVDRSPPPASTHRDLLYAAQGVCGRIATQLEQWPEAESMLQQSIAGYEQLVAENPNVPAHREAVAATYANLATALVRQGKTDQAMECHRICVKIYAELQTIEQLRVIVVRQQMDLEYDLAIELSKDQPQEAISLFRNVLVISESILDREENPTLWRLDRLTQARTHNRLGLLLGRPFGKHDEAIEHFERCEEICRELIERFPEELKPPVMAGGALCNWADALGRLGETKASISVYDNAISLLETVHSDLPVGDEGLEYLVKSLAGRATALRADKQTDAALADWQRAIAIGAHPSSQALARINAGLIVVARGEQELAVEYAAAANQMPLSAVQKGYLALLFTRLADGATDDSAKQSHLASAANLLQQARSEDPAVLKPLEKNVMLRKYAVELGLEQ